MNHALAKQLRIALFHLPNWAVSTLSVIFGLMVAMNIITWDALCVFFAQPFHDWFGELWNVIMGALISAGGIMYDPRAEKTILLTEEVE